MSSSTLLTAEEFAVQLFDLPEGGRWHELEAGRVLMHEPPDHAHGNIVLNLSKALGEYLHQRRDEPVGYACFEIGFIVSREPDTVRRPAISFFSAKSLFSESDALVTESVPSIVVEAASTNSRRNALTDRVNCYHEFGVDQVWVADPIDRVVHVCERSRTPRQLSEHRALHGEPYLPGFSMTVGEIFAEPEWWR